MVEIVICWSTHKISFMQMSKRCTTLFNYKKNINAFRGTYGKMSFATEIYLKRKWPRHWYIDIWCKVKWKPIRKGATWNSMYVCSIISWSQSYCTERCICWWMFVWFTKFKGCNDKSRSDWAGIEQRTVFTKRSDISWKCLKYLIWLARSHW